MNNANLQALDKALSGFAAKKVNDLIVDLRASSATSDLSLAADFAKRFCPKGKPIFTISKPAGRQDRVFSSDREPIFRGLLVVLTDSDTQRRGRSDRVRAPLLQQDTNHRPTHCGSRRRILGSTVPGGKILVSPWLK